jgi:lysylphosphatidylglycerol synthetase-like protein (DUF2156 family)
MAAGLGGLFAGLIAPPIAGVLVVGGAVAHPVVDAIATLIGPRLSEVPYRGSRWKVVATAVYLLFVGALLHFGARYFAPGAVSLPPIPPAIRTALGVAVAAAGVAVAVGALRGRRSRSSTRWTTSAGLLAGAAIVSLVAWPWGFRSGFPIELVVPLSTIALAVSAFGAYLVNHVVTVSTAPLDSRSRSRLSSKAPEA